MSLKQEYLRKNRDILLNEDLNNPNWGLMNGLGGMALFLYVYSKIKDDADARKMADKMIKKIWSLKIFKLSNNLYTGISGIGWVFEFLIQNDFLEYNKDIEKILTVIDSRVVSYASPVQIDPVSGLFSCGLYFLNRSKHDELLLKYCTKERLIYLTEESERLLFKPTYKVIYDVNKLTLSLFNSVLYYLIQVHKHLIFPYKTEKLLSNFRMLSKINICIGNLSDIITYKILIETLKELLPIEFTFNLPDEKYIKNISIDSAIINLSQASFCSLIYNNNEIFSQTFKILNQEYPNLMTELVNYKWSKFSLSMNGLSAIGYGLLFFNK